MSVHVEKRETIRNGRVFDITVESVTFPNGVNIDLEIIRHPGASAIVPITAENQVIMLKQYRHAVGGDLWEIPAGTFDGEEDPLVCAKRELREETGFEAQQWNPMGTVTPVPGYSDEKIHLFLARQMTPSTQQLDSDEIIEVHPLPLDEVVKMIIDGHIDDAKTIVAIFRALHLINHR